MMYPLTFFIICPDDAPVTFQPSAALDFTQRHKNSADMAYYLIITY